MSNLREAAQQALAVLSDDVRRCNLLLLDKITNDLRAALAEPVQPVAWMCPDDPERETAFNWKAGHCENCGKQRIPLYTAPPQSSINAELVEALRAIAAMSPYSNDVMDAIVLADGALAKVEASNE